MDVLNEIPFESYYSWSDSFSAFPDGTVPLCSRPGRPTPDSLFVDPTRGGTAFKIFDMNDLRSPLQLRSEEEKEK
jgi:hypothetical protein